jgi:hypothetical protein
MSENVDQVSTPVSSIASRPAWLPVLIAGATQIPVARRPPALVTMLAASRCTIWNVPVGTPQGTGQRAPGKFSGSRREFRYRLSVPINRRGRRFVFLRGCFPVFFRVTERLLMALANFVIWFFLFMYGIPLNGGTVHPGNARRHPCSLSAFRKDVVRRILSTELLS